MCESVMNNTGSLLHRLKTEPEYRLRFLTFLCLVWSFFILGWILGQFGPSIFDLQYITNTDLEGASFYYISHNVGYLIGSLISGVLIGRCDCNFLLFITMCIYGISVFAIPWCFLSSIMLVAQAIRGLSGGLLDTVANSELLSLFGNQVSPYMQAMHFAFAAGGIASPLVTAPFLTEQYDNGVNSSMINQTSLVMQTENVRTDNISFHMNNITTVNRSTTFHTQKNSLIYIPYTISGVLAMSSSVSFLIVYIKSRRLAKRHTDEVNIDRNERRLSFPVKLVILTIMSIIFLLYTAMEDTIGAYVATFCVEQMNMTKEEGSYVTAVFWTFFAFGRLSGIPISNIVKSIPLIGIYSFILVISFLLLSFSPMINSPVTVWISNAVTGFAMSILFPTLFTWAEEDFLLVTGKIASLFIMTSTLGSIASPAALGYLIEEVSPMWYSYILLGESVGVIIFFVIAILLKKKLPQLNDNTNRSNKEIKIDADSSPERSVLMQDVPENKVS
ncbi:sodium-dependent glucose transporter 1B-like [Mytilus californianus]|uniref:sodium-dependent glucose transporter 1B-like n=1 Tax=Mytilus californianus TaxID=6549 RepID=UPI002245AD97|nr:sodium-dependent glucose transporter 1B-like [Mytilus californianus]